jgi:hypothetical protein
VLANYVSEHKQSAAISTAVVTAIAWLARMPTMLSLIHLQQQTTACSQSCHSTACAYFTV